MPTTQMDSERICGCGKASSIWLERFNRLLFALVPLPTLDRVNTPPPQVYHSKTSFDCLALMRIIVEAEYANVKFSLSSCA